MSVFLNKEIKPEPVSEFSTTSILVILLAMMVLGLLFGSGLSTLIMHLKGINLETILSSGLEDSSAESRNLLRTVTLINHFFTFLAPALLLAFFLKKRRWTHYLYINLPPKHLNIGLAVFLIFWALPLAQFVFWINKQIPLPELFEHWEGSAGSAIQNLIIMESPGELLSSLFVMAILPAIGEEFVFRGVVQKNLGKAFRNPHLGLWVAALLFSAIHFQFMGFLPRLLLGLVLGYLFFWTNNLWVPIAGHFFFNAIQVFAAYFMSDEIETLNLEGNELIPLPIIIISFIFVAITAYTIRRVNV